MIKSMTGFGRGKAEEDGRELTVEIKSLNHRYCDIGIRIPKQISFLEDKVRASIRKKVSRGKIEVYINYDNLGKESKSIIIDEELASAYVRSVKCLKDMYNLKDDISVTSVAQFPDILVLKKLGEDEEKIWAILDRALNDALDALVNMRSSEGENLMLDLLKRTDLIENNIKEISIRAPEVVKNYKDRLESRIKDLLEQKIVDEARLATEVAIFSDRCSIDEELIRLGSHIRQLRETLGFNQPVGRKLDFLLQEMNREINTIGSKASDLDIINHVVEIKSDLEKIKEQIQNIE